MPDKEQEFFEKLDKKNWSAAEKLRSMHKQ